MRRTFPALPALAVAVVVALVAALVALAMAGSSGQGRPGDDLVAAAASGPDEDPDEGADVDDAGPPSDKAKAGTKARTKARARHGNGPPSWAHGRAGKQAHAEWQKRWHGMSEQQREATMRRLSQEHTAGMKAWAKCHSEGREGCSKPMPPGLAKKG